MLISSRVRRARRSFFATIVAASVLATALVVVQAPQPVAADVTGDGGRFVSAEGRILDTRDGTGGYSTPGGAMEWRRVAVAGKAGIPTSGVSAVVLMASVANPQTNAVLLGRPDADTAWSTLLIATGKQGWASNSATVAVATDGSIQIATDTPQDVTLDVQGYYTAGSGTTPGGFVPLAGARIVDTEHGVGAPTGTVPNNGSVTVQVTGANGIPAGASAVAVSIIVTNRGERAGYVTPYAAGEAVPVTALNYGPKNDVATSMGAQVELSADGRFTIKNTSNGTSPIQLLVEVQGYFTATNKGGSFTPATARLLDTRSTANAFPSDGEISVPVAGRGGLPAMESGLSAVVVTLTTRASSNSEGWVSAWADGTPQPDPYTSATVVPNVLRSATAIVKVGQNGAIRLKNGSTGSVDVIVDVQGWYNSLPIGPETTGLTGSRPSATNLSFGISDQTSFQVDVATGNLNLSAAAMSAAGVSSRVPFGASYNSRGRQPSQTDLPEANRWQYALGAAGELSANGTGVVYTGADGSTWQFTPTGTSGAFTSPAGLQQTLQRTATEYVMTGWTTNQKVAFNFAGQPTSIKDRNKNAVVFNRDGFVLENVTSSAGPVDARKVTTTYTDGVFTLAQASGGQTRTAVFTKNSAGNLVSFTNTLGARTLFEYTGNDLTKITAPGGAITTITYDADDRVTRVTQANTTTGSPGAAITRLSYTSSTQTLVAGPNTDPAVAVASVPRTTYTVNAGTRLVTKAVDAAGREQSRTYNPANNAADSSTTGSGATASTTKGTFGANDKQSLTNVQSATGSASSSTYGSGVATAYLPATSTDSASETTTYGFDGVGNQLSTQTGSGALSATAKLEYNTDGTIKTATAPANAGNPSKYVYNANKQLSTITPPTGTSLGVKTFTYDVFGRQATQTDGRGGTTTFTYDKADRLLSTSFSDSTATVANTYDTNGNQLTQKSGTGTVTNTFDQQNRLTSTTNTAGGGTIRFGYDKASSETSTTSATGTTTHTYDPSGVLTSSTYPDGVATATQRYETDDKGRRTNTWLASNADHTLWAARTLTAYDDSGRIKQIRAWTGTGDASNKAVFDTSYCYQAGSTAPTCGTTPANDRDTIQWARDNLTGQVTTYGYTTGRLTSATQTGGTTNSAWTYSYDLNGNRTSEKTTGANAGTINLTFNAASQITTSGYSYDGAGNLTASPGATYTYNGAQQMVSSTRGGVTTTYTYAGTDQNALLSERVTGGKSYDYVYGGADGQGVPEIVSQNTSGAGISSVLSDPVTGQALNLTTAEGVTGLYLVDAIGNQIGLLTDTRTTAFRVAYAPYGAQTVTVGATSDEWEQNPYGFKTGNRTDNGVLVKFGMRWYLAITGTWTQRDTLDAPLDPKNANRYGYAGGDPINASDPTGRNSTSIGGQACYGFCIGASIDFDSDGNVGYSIEFGVGSPGGGAGVTKSTGDVSNEVYAGGQCSAGPATVSAGTDGLSGGVGASYSSAYCAGYVGFSKTF